MDYRRIRSLISRIEKREGNFVRDVAFMIVLSFIASLLHYVFFVYLGRNLPPQEYATLGVLLSAYFISFFIASTLTNIVIRYISIFKAKSQIYKISVFVHKSLRTFTYFGAVFAIATFMIFTALSDHIETPLLSLVFLSAYILFHFIFSTTSAALGGLQKYRVLGTVRFAQAFMTVIIGYLFVMLGWSITGVLLAFAIGTAMAILLAYAPVSNILTVKNVKLGDIGLRSYSLRASLITLLVSGMMNIDLIFAKILLDPVEAGTFSASSMIAKLPFLLSVMFTNIMFSKGSERHSNGKETKNILKHSLMYIAAAGIALSVLTLFFKDLIARLLFGDVYSFGAYLFVFTLSSSLMSLSNAILMYELSINRTKKLLRLWPFILFQIVLYSLLHESIFQLILVNLVVSIFFLVAVYLLRKDELYYVFKKRDLTHTRFILALLRRRRRS